MAVIGSTLQLPPFPELISFEMLFMLVGLLLAAGLAWLIVDYGRMLLLHKKMVSSGNLKFGSDLC